MRAVLFASFILFVLGSQSALGYEDDVHYGLTKWLALKAGFPSKDAETIAYGDKYVDGGALDAVRLVFFSACIREDAAGSDTVLKHHFPSGATVPSPPVAREVTENSTSARIMVERVIASPQRSFPDRDLRDFGTGLHALQDSFSHEGVPDVPGFLFIHCHSQYAWGHPAASGGWSSHNADLTYLYQAKAMKMARVTYAQLCKYREIVQSARCALPWEDLQATLEGFVQASTKAQKMAWFRSDETTRGEIKCESLAGIDLPDGGDWCESVQGRYPGTVETLSLNRDVIGVVAKQREKSPKAIIEATLDTWFVKRDVVALTRFFVDQAAFKSAYNLADYSQDKAAAASTALFYLRLIPDHGSVSARINLTGNALMNLDVVQSAIKFGVTDQFSPPKGSRLLKYRTLSEALYEVGPGKELFDFQVVPCKDGKEECALAAARLKNAPYENLLLEYHKQNGRWLLVSTRSLVDH
jgi:Family of unknown function (DUF6765)